MEERLLLEKTSENASEEPKSGANIPENGDFWSFPRLSSAPGSLIEIRWHAGGASIIGGWVLSSSSYYYFFFFVNIAK
jgi:hypothetical protein